MPPSDLPPFQYAPGYAKINRIAVLEAVQEIPRTLRPMARLFLIERIIIANWQDGLCQNIDPPIQINRGQLVMGRAEMAETLGFSSDISVRSIVSWLGKLQIVSSQSSNRGTILTIVNFDLYSPFKDKLSRKASSRYPAGIHSKEEVEEVDKEKKPPQVYPQEVEAALKIWTDLAALPSSANPDACRKTLNELYCIDKLPWDRINAICEHAAREWVPAGYIASPAKLRKPTRSGEMKTWEAIERQLSAKSNHVGLNNGKPSALQVADEIMAKAARMEKEQGELLARRRKEAGL